MGAPGQQCGFGRTASGSPRCPAVSRPVHPRPQGAPAQCHRSEPSPAPRARLPAFGCRSTMVASTTKVSSRRRGPADVQANRKHTIGGHAPLCRGVAGEVKCHDGHQGGLSFRPLGFGPHDCFEQAGIDIKLRVDFGSPRQRALRPCPLDKQRCRPHSLKSLPRAAKREGVGRLLVGHVARSPTPARGLSRSLLGRRAGGLTRLGATGRSGHQIECPGIAGHPAQHDVHDHPPIGCQGDGATVQPYPCRQVARTGGYPHLMADKLSRSCDRSHREYAHLGQCRSTTNFVIGAEPGAARRQAGWPRHWMRWERGVTAGAAATPSLAPR